MRTQLRTKVIAGVAVALVLVLPSPTSASPGATRPPGTAPAAAGQAAGRGFSHAEARALLEQVRAALDPRTPAARTSALPRADLTMALRDLRRALPALTPAERASATSALAAFPPPSSTCGGLLGSAVVKTAHFCVHYGNGNTAWATTTADVLENVWSTEVDGLGFQHPPYDGDGLFDVYLQNLGAGYYGACAPNQNAPQSTSSCVLDDDFDPAQFGGTPAMSSLQVTAAHEFFHAVQFGYDTTEDIWLMEGSAVWAEEQVYPTINDYLQYLPYSALTHPATPVDYKGVTSTDLYYRYGAVLFWKFLSGELQDPGIIRRVWEYAAVPGYYSLVAVTAALGERGWSFAHAFARFGVWNTGVPGYDDRALYPGPVWWQTATLGRRHRDTGTRTVALDHLTNASLLVAPARRLPKRTRLRVRVDAPALDRMSQATVQVRHRDGSVSLVDVPLDGAGDGSVRLGFDPRLVGAIVVTLTNASTRMSACGSDSADRFACAGLSADDTLPFSVRATVRLRKR